jgi:hypothetical protein
LYPFVSLGAIFSQKRVRAYYGIMLDSLDNVKKCYNMGENPTSKSGVLPNSTEFQKGAESK